MKHINAICIATALLLCGCATTAPAPTSSAPACLPLSAYTLDQQKALASALDALPPGSPLVGAMVDYEAMRAADRACIASAAAAH